MTLNGRIIQCGSCGCELRLPTMEDTFVAPPAPVSAGPQGDGCADLLLGLVIVSLPFLIWGYFMYPLHQYFFSQFNPTSIYLLFSSRFQVLSAEVLAVHALLAEVLFTLTVFLVSDYEQIDRFTRRFLICGPLLFLLLPLFSFLADSNDYFLLIAITIYEAIFIVFCVGIWPAMIKGCEFFSDKH